MLVSFGHDRIALRMCRCRLAKKLNGVSVVDVTCQLATI